MASQSRGRRLERESIPLNDTRPGRGRIGSSLWYKVCIRCLGGNEMNRTVLVWLCLLGAVVAAAGQDPVALGDEAWARRADGSSGGWAAQEPIGEAVAAYQAAIEAEPQRLEAYWKLLRAIYFQGDYAARDKEEKQEVLSVGKEVGEQALDLLAERVGGRQVMDAKKPEEIAEALRDVPEAAGIFFWSAVDWGLWGDSYGRMAAARQGVAGRVRDYTQVVLALDEGFERAGGHRVLGRLHTLAPRFPFVTGWVSRDKAVSELRRAVEMAPDEPLNGFYLAEALVEFRPKERSEAVELLRELAQREPDPEWQLEDERTLEDARRLLAKLEAE